MKEPRLKKKHKQWNPLRGVNWRLMPVGRINNVYCFGDAAGLAARHAEDNYNGFFKGRRHVTRRYGIARCAISRFVALIVPVKAFAERNIDEATPHGSNSGRVERRASPQPDRLARSF
ncbi:hypothetical protein EVAR_52456_1 [Eumeta japonica]|uniref:Uncharacterized protein n=1 Tax=Eumeta variegata TaxID=151549 RepID=A0A4C1Z4I8_EUMVA|nr:hypothetical protein EVAR_52456_1 [Eumeta japonica]